MIMDVTVLPDLTDRLAALGATDEEVRGFEYYSEPEQTYIVGACVERQMDTHLQILFSCLWCFTAEELDELNAPEPEPFNLALHDYLLTLGATHEHVAEDWEDDGDAESGPHLTGHPAFDLYTLDDVEYVVTADGTVERQPASPPFDTQGIECDAVSR
jgi:hypothetical protein